MSQKIEKTHIERLKIQGAKLAEINKKCSGVPREEFDGRTGKSKFTTCVIMEAAKIFAKKEETPNV